MYVHVMLKNIKPLPFDIRIINFISFTICFCSSPKVLRTKEIYESHCDSLGGVLRRMVWCAILC